MEVGDREKAVCWARSLLDRTGWILLDTETTGMSGVDEIIQMAVLAPDGAVLMNTLLRPTQPIPYSATTIHGITDADVIDAPTFPEIYDNFKDLISGKTLVIYNAVFDLRLIKQTLSKFRLPAFEISEDQVDCAMLQYSAWVGESWPVGGYKWQKLIGGDHTALGDCRATLEVIKKMAGD